MRIPLTDRTRCGARGARCATRALQRRDVASASGSRVDGSASARARCSADDERRHDPAGRGRGGHRRARTGLPRARRVPRRVGDAGHRRAPGARAARRAPRDPRPPAPRHRRLRPLPGDPLELAAARRDADGPRRGGRPRDRARARRRRLRDEALLAARARRARPRRAPPRRARDRGRQCSCSATSSSTDARAPRASRAWRSSSRRASSICSGTSASGPASSSAASGSSIASGASPSRAGRGPWTSTSRQLRRKLDRPELIRTIRGSGYKLVAPMSLRSRLFLGIAATVLVSLVVTVVAGALLTRRSLEQTAVRRARAAGRADRRAATRRAGARAPRRELGRFLATDEQRLAIVTPAQAALLLPDERRGTPSRGGCRERHASTCAARGFSTPPAAAGDEAIVLLRPAASQAADWRPFALGLGLAGLVGAAARRARRVRCSRVPSRDRSRASPLRAGRSPRAAAPTRCPSRGRARWRRSRASFNDLSAELDRTHEAERAFLLSVSHELKTPLTAIRGHAEALEDGVLEPAAAGIGDRARGAAARAARRRPARPRPPAPAHLLGALGAGRPR